MPVLPKGRSISGREGSTGTSRRDCSRRPSGGRRVGAADASIWRPEGRGSDRRSHRREPTPVRAAPEERTAEALRGPEPSGVVHASISASQPRVFDCFESRVRWRGSSPPPPRLSLAWETARRGLPDHAQSWRSPRRRLYSRLCKLKYVFDGRGALLGNSTYFLTPQIPQIPPATFLSSSNIDGHSTASSNRSPTIAPSFPPRRPTCSPACGPPPR